MVAPRGDVEWQLLGSIDAKQLHLLGPKSCEVCETWGEKQGLQAE